MKPAPINAQHGVGMMEHARPAMTGCATISIVTKGSRESGLWISRNKGRKYQPQERGWAKVERPWLFKRVQAFLKLYSAEIKSEGAV